MGECIYKHTHTHMHAISNRKKEAMEFKESEGGATYLGRFGGNKWKEEM